MDEGRNLPDHHPLIRSDVLRAARLDLRERGIEFVHVLRGYNPTDKVRSVFVRLHQSLQVLIPEDRAPRLRVGTQ